MKSQLSAFNAKAGMYTLKEDDDMKAKLVAVTRRLEELERSGKKIENPTPSHMLRKKRRQRKGRKWKTKRERSVKRRRTMIQQ